MANRHAIEMCQFVAPGDSGLQVDRLGRHLRSSRSHAKRTSIIHRVNEPPGSRTNQHIALAAPYLWQINSQLPLSVLKVFLPYLEHVSTYDLVQCSDPPFIKYGTLRFHISVAASCFCWRQIIRWWSLSFRRYTVCVSVREIDNIM